MTVQGIGARPSHGVLAGLQILEAFEHGTGAVSLTELAARTGIAKASALRHLKALAQMGYVTQDARRKTYALGPAILALSERFIAQQPGVHACRPFLVDTANETGETAHYAVLRGADVIYLEIAESPNRVRAYVSPGDRLPAHCTASGKAVLAHTGPETVDAVLGSSPRKLTGRTITGETAFRDELAATRRRGYGVNLAEWMDEVSAASAPVFSASGAVIGAIGVAGPISRLGADRIHGVGEAVRRHAARYTQTLCGRATEDATPSGSNKEDSPCV